MTQIDEPIFKQVDDILNELINVACNYEKGKDVDLDAKANETNHALQALIATQVQEARIDELEKLLSDDGQCICQLANQEVCDHNWSLCNTVKDRIAQIRSKG